MTGLFNPQSLHYLFDVKSFFYLGIGLVNLVTLSVYSKRLI